MACRKAAFAPSVSPCSCSKTHDELSFRIGHELMAADGFTFGLGLEPGMQRVAYLKLLADHHAG